MRKKIRAILMKRETLKLSKDFLKESETKWNQLKEKKKVKNLINIPNSVPVDVNGNGVTDGYKIDKNN